MALSAARGENNLFDWSSRAMAVTPQRTPLGALGGWLGMLLVSLLAGVLVTAAVTPVVGLTGATASTGIGVFEDMPDYLKISPPSQKSNIFATKSDGSRVLLASFYDQNRINVAWQDIGQNVKDAAIAAEDPRYFDHGGIDLQGTARAVIATVSGRDVQGGSSITQQYVKNVLVQQCTLLNNDKDQKSCYNKVTATSIDRKLKEMRLSIGLEKQVTKDQILLGYLNIVGFGGTVYGIEAAAEYYFSTTASALTLSQAAALIAIVNNPVKFRLDDPNSASNGAANGYAANKERRNYILDQMLRYKVITKADFDTAMAESIEPKINQPSTGCQTAGDNAYFCDYVTHKLRNDPVFGADADTRMMNFRRGGYDIYTTIDLDLQAAAVQAIADNVPQTYPGWDVGGVITSVQVGTGRVLTMAQNKIYSQDPDVLSQGPQYTSINYNTDYEDGGSSGFQPGSSYKVYTLAEWLKEGHSLNDTVNSARKSNWGTFQDSCEGPQSYPGWNPKNDAGEAGTNYSALQSTIGSINTGYIGMAKELDLCGIRKTAEAFGMHRADGSPLLESAATVLGTNEIAPLTQAVAFAGIANNGVTCSPIAIDKILDRNGNPQPSPQSSCVQSVSPGVAAAMHYAMSAVMTSGTGTASYGRLSPRVPVIGKTGTTDGNKDTWMCGASTKVATVAAVVSLTGDADQRSISMPNGTSAALERHLMWPAVMSVANAKYGGESFTTVSPSARGL